MPCYTLVVVACPETDLENIETTLLNAGGARGGDVLHEAALLGLSLPWGDVNSTGMHAIM